MTKRQRTVLILILGFIAMLGPFSIDMYLPGFKAVANDLDTEISRVSLTLTSYFIGISIGQLFYGPLLDRYGRLKPMMVGMSIYLVSTLVAALSPNIDWLIGSRFFMAIGGCSGMVATRAIIRDRFDGNDVARVFSALILVMGAAPIIAPTIGGYVVSQFGWRSIFYILVGISAAILILVRFVLKESKEEDKTVSLNYKKVARGYWEVLSNKQFLLYGLAGSLSMAGLFTYISGSPFVLMKIFGFDETTYGWVFGINASFFIIGSQINGIILKKHDILKITKISAGIFLIIGILISISLVGNFLDKWGFIILLMGFMFMLGFINPNTMALSLLPFQINAGMASALNGSLRMLSGALASGMIGWFHDGTMKPMFVIMTSFTVLVFVFVHIALTATHDENESKEEEKEENLEVEMAGSAAK